MNLIVAVDRNWAIGKNGKLLVAIPEDQKLFREETTNKVVVMGRKTLESLPGGQPLSMRKNLILSADPDYQVKNADVCHSLDEALKYLQAYPRESIYIIGGESIYRQFLPFCDTAHVTYVDYGYHADTYFPNLDRAEDWVLKEASEERTYFDLIYEFRRYVNKKGH